MVPQRSRHRAHLLMKAVRRLLAVMPTRARRRSEGRSGGEMVRVHHLHRVNPRGPAWNRCKRIPLPQPPNGPNARWGIGKSTRMGAAVKPYTPDQMVKIALPCEYGLLADGLAPPRSAPASGPANPLDLIRRLTWRIIRGSPRRGHDVQTPRSSPKADPIWPTP